MVINHQPIFFFSLLFRNHQLVMLSIVVFFSLYNWFHGNLWWAELAAIENHMLDPKLASYCWTWWGDRDVKKQLVAPWKQILPVTPWSKYMAQSPKGRFILGLDKPIHGNCAIYFYPGVIEIQLLTYHRRAVWQANSKHYKENIGATLAV